MLARKAMLGGTEVTVLELRNETKRLYPEPSTDKTVYRDLVAVLVYPDGTYGIQSAYHLKDIGPCPSSQSGDVTSSA